MHHLHCHSLPWVEEGEGLTCIVEEGEEGLTCIIYTVTPSTLGGGEGLTCFCEGLIFVERWEGSFASYLCLPLPWVEVGEGLIDIVHKVSSSTLGGGGGGAH